MIIAIIHQKGGVGKSTIACNLAVELNEDMLDLDSQQSSILFNKLRKRSGLKELTCNTADTVEEIKKIVSEYKHSKKNLIVDCGGFDNDLNRTVMILADILITPLSPSQFEIFGLQTLSKTLIKASSIVKKEIKTHVLINNIDPRSKVVIRELKEHIANKENLIILNSILHTRSDFKHSIGVGQSVKEYNKKSKASEELTMLTEEIKEIIKSIQEGE